MSTDYEALRVRVAKLETTLAEIDTIRERHRKWEMWIISFVRDVLGSLRGADLPSVW